jgi:phasin family protein
MKISEMISERVNAATAGIREPWMDLGEKADAALRRSLTGAADRIEGVHAPLEVLVSAGQRINSIGHACMTRLLEKQTGMLKAVAKDGAKGLRRIAAADSMPQAMQQQVALMGEARERVVRDARAMLELLGSGGRDVAEVTSRAFGELRGERRTRRAPVRSRRAKAAPAARARKRARKGKAAATAASSATQN